MPLLGGVFRAATCAAALLALLPLGGRARAQESEAQAVQSDAEKAPASVAADPSTLRICASEKQPPLSMKDGSGLENRIAVAVAEAMGRKPVLVWLSKPAIYLVRDGLEKRLCDVVIGLDSDDPRSLDELGIAAEERAVWGSEALVERDDHVIGG